MITISQTFPLDPNIKTGDARVISSPARMGAIIVDVPYSLTSPEFATWLYVGVTGNVEIMKWDGTTIILTGMLGGVWHPVSSIMVVSAGTTATNLVWGS
jgi:hypothetical protein